MFPVKSDHVTEGVSIKAKIQRYQTDTLDLKRRELHVPPLAKRDHVLHMKDLTFHKESQGMNGRGNGGSMEEMEKTCDMAAQSKADSPCGRRQKCQTGQDGERERGWERCADHTYNGAEQQRCGSKFEGEHGQRCRRFKTVLSVTKARVHASEEKGCTKTTFAKTQDQKPEVDLSRNCIIGGPKTLQNSLQKICETCLANNENNDGKEAIKDKATSTENNMERSVVVTGQQDDKQQVPSHLYEDNPILRRIKDSVIGKDLEIHTPFGQRKVVYCDYTASGRCLSVIEDFIRQTVMPTYANTHSTIGYNARQTGHFREEARNIIKKCVNASPDDAVIFTGSGATAGMHKVAWALSVNVPRVAMDTVVFIGPYEHHSNILLWREYGVQVIRIRQEHGTGMIDLGHLSEELQIWKKKRRHLLVCMSAASNVTGIITDVTAVSRIAHQHGALAFFDYAGGAPYMKIDMNPSETDYKDAIILSPHKFVGGPGTPGLVVAKKWVFRNHVPDRVGGGTVKFVTREVHAYVGNLEEREEGGTPAIIESIRAGLVFKLKQEIGSPLLQQRERELCDRAFAVWESNPCIHILGPHRADRVPIFSFLVINEETSRLVHHDFISALLSDIFGIQSRSGCACAGPYAVDLLGIPESLSKKYLSLLSAEHASADDHAVRHFPLFVMKPGFTRVNLTYCLDDATLDFVIKAIDLTARYGWKLLPEYTFDPQTSVWQHITTLDNPGYQLASLEDFSASWTPTLVNIHRATAPELKEVLEKAKRLFDEAGSTGSPRPSFASQALRAALPPQSQSLRWFMTPEEAAIILSDQAFKETQEFRLPFKLLRFPNRFPRRDDADGEGRRRRPLRSVSS